MLPARSAGRARDVPPHAPLRRKDPRLVERRAKGDAARTIVNRSATEADADAAPPAAPGADARTGSHPLGQAGAGAVAGGAGGRRRAVRPTGLALLSVRSQADQQHAIVQQLAQQNSGLERQQRELNQTATIISDARALGMVKQGERPYVVTGLPGH